MVCLDRFARITLPLVLGVISTGCLCGCEDRIEASSDSEASAEPSPAPDAGTAPDAATEGEGFPPDSSLAACAERAAGLSMPKSIAETLARINAMPMPVTLSCFVASLPRPLQMTATDSVFSAQPANGRTSPRIFLLTDALVLSVVPDGPGGHLLEFGEFVTPTSTIKGEIVFPVTEPLTATAPYEHLLYSETLTVCGFCHRIEKPHPSIEGAFESEAFRPEPGSEVPLSELRDYAATACEPGAPRARCDMMQALFSLGTVEQGFFDEELPKFFP